MKTSELIKKLKEFQETHRDSPVLIQENCFRGYSIAENNGPKFLIADYESKILELQRLIYKLRTKHHSKFQVQGLLKGEEKFFKRVRKINSLIDTSVGFKIDTLKLNAEINKEKDIDNLINFLKKSKLCFKK